MIIQLIFKKKKYGLLLLENKKNQLLFHFRKYDTKNEDEKMVFEKF